jgi:hypothetical protein
MLNNLKSPLPLGAYKGGGLTSFKVVLGGETRGLLVYAGVFVRGTCNSIRGGFLKALVEPRPNGLDELELFGWTHDAHP